MDICGAVVAALRNSFTFLVFCVGHIWLFCTICHYIIIHFNIIHFVLGKVNIYEVFCKTKGCMQKNIKAVLIYILYSPES